MQQDAERKAFARAWGYLSYNAVAKWAALLAAVGAGVLYVALLIVLWLFADLVVSHGAIPRHDALFPSEQASFAEKLKADAQRRRDEAQARKEEPAEGVVFDPPRLRHLASGDPQQVLKLPDPDQELLWRVYLHRLLRDNVDARAAAFVLPRYHDLPRAEQEAVLEVWRQAHAFDREPLLAGMGFADERRVARLVKADPNALTPPDKEAIWQAFLYRAYDPRRDEDPAAAGIADAADTRLRALAAGEEGAGLEDDRPLDDRGILSLYVRSHVHDKVSTPVVGRLARWNGWWMWKHGNARYLTGLLVVGVVLALLRAGLLFLQQEMAARATIEASTRLRRAAYHHTFRLGTLAFKALGPSEAVTVFTRHVEAVHDALYTWLTVVAREPVKFVLLLAFALLVNFWLALAFLLFALLVWLIGGQVAAYLRRQARTATSQMAERLTLIRESLMLMRLVKVYAMELFNQSRVERQLARYASAQRMRYRGEAVYRPVLIALGTLAVLVLLYVAGLIVLHGQLGVASAIALATALVSLYWPAVALLESRRILRRGRESAVQLFGFLDRPGDVGQVVGAEFLPPMGKRLEFDNVSLREPGSNRLLLQNVSLTIQAGQRVGLIGPDDLEKHALVYLIPRLLDPSSGEVRIDEHNLRWVTLDSLRAQIGMVMQHNLVFHDTVANNIGCGDPSYTLPQIIEAAKTAHAHHFIQRLPEGYETPIGELGHSLAVGEQFRIALARAILRDPAILVIEEPETPLDENTKALVDDTFNRVLQGRTVLFLPHRISTIRSLEQIYLLHRGRVEAEGEHRELLAQNPLYRHLHYIEFNEMAEQV